VATRVLKFKTKNMKTSNGVVNAVKTSPVDMGARKELDIRPGDTVRVWQKIEEKGKVRLQAFEGLVLARKHGREAGGTFTVRRIASGVGVEKIFPLYTPMIERVEIVKRSRVRRAKLYFIRDKAARESRRQLRRSKIMDTRVTSDVVNKEKAAALEKLAKEVSEETGVTAKSE
jgi:large subunit ribosomal protein L19